MHTMLLVVTLIVITINALGILMGRIARSRWGHLAFGSGLVGLCAAPLAFVAARIGYVPAPLDGPTPFDGRTSTFLIICLVVLTVATLGTLAALIAVWRARSNQGSEHIAR